MLKKILRLYPLSLLIVFTSIVGIRQMRKRFVCGLQEESIQRRLLTEANLIFVQAVQIAQEQKQLGEV